MAIRFFGIDWMLIPIALAAMWLVPLVSRYVPGRTRVLWGTWCAVSIATAAVIAFSAHRESANVWSWLGLGAAVVPLGALFAIDALTHRLPRQVSLVTAVPVVALLVFGDGPGGRWSVVLAAAVNVLVTLVLRSVTRGSLGMGDVMIAPLLGSIVGWFDPWSLVFLWLVASVLGATWSAILLSLGRRSRRDHIAYGPFLIVGTLAAVLGSTL